MKRGRYRHKKGMFEINKLAAQRPATGRPDFLYEDCLPPNAQVMDTAPETKRPETPTPGLWARFKGWLGGTVLRPQVSHPVRPAKRQYQAQGDQDPRPRG